MTLALIGAVFIGLSLGIFGSGGSILTVPVLLYLAQMPANTAIASSLLIVGVVSLFGSISSVRKGLVSWSHVWWFGLPGMIGAYLGAWAGAYVDSRLQLAVFVLLMAVAAWFMWHGRNQAKAAAEVNILRIVIDGLVVGAITGFVGVGGGFLIVPALVLLGGVSMVMAIGTSLLIIAAKSFVGFGKYYAVLSEQGYSFDWQVIGLVAAFGVLGSFAGAAIGARLPKHLLQKGFAIFLLLMAGFVLTQSVL